MKIQMIAKSDVGKLREINEDYCGIFEEQHLAILCDGMGGHNAGAQASRLAVSTIRYMYHFLDEEKQLIIASDLDDRYQEIAARLVSSVRLANRHIFNRACQNNKYNGMGTTVSALSIINDIACICHVGDSRIYRFRDEDIELLTEDHSWLNELIQDNEIKEEEASKFEKKNVITRALGLAPTVKIDLKLEPICSGDLFLLCSDGLTGGVSDEDIKKIILSNRDNLKEAANQLINSANLVDGSDNITVTLVDIIEHNPQNNSFEPVNMTLKPEDNSIVLLENKILKREFSGYSILDKIKDKFGFFWNNSLAKLSVIISILLTIALIIKSFSINQKSERGVLPSETVKNVKETSSKEINNNSHVNLRKTFQNTLTSSVSTNLDSNIFNDSLKRAITDTEKIHIKSLNNSLQDEGLIYLVGLENDIQDNKTYLFLNKKLLGNTNDFLESGIHVMPGEYEIAIKDTNNNSIIQLSKIHISSGDIKAIELTSNQKK